MLRKWKKFYFSQQSERRPKTFFFRLRSRLPVGPCRMHRWRRRWRRCRRRRRRRVDATTLTRRPSLVILALTLIGSKLLGNVGRWKQPPWGPIGPFNIEGALLHSNSHSLSNFISSGLASECSIFGSGETGKVRNELDVDKIRIRSFRVLFF